MNEIILTETDHQRLLSLVAHHANESLEAELQRAAVVPRGSVPSDVVTMNTELVYEDVATGARRVVRLVYPHDADARRGWISVLAPIGSALLGLRLGQTIDWPTPSGEKRVRVVEVRWQPEAAGEPDR